MNGLSTCFAPNCKSNRKLATNMKKINLLNGLNCNPLVLPMSEYGNTNIETNAANIAITPSSLFGMLLKIA